MLDENRNNFSAAYMPAHEDMGMCFADISTGVVYATDTEEWVDMYNEAGSFFTS